MIAIKLIEECPSCGNVFTNKCPFIANSKGYQLHISNNQCGCGRRSNFKIISLNLIEVDEIVDKNCKKNKKRI